MMVPSRRWPRPSPVLRGCATPFEHLQDQHHRGRSDHRSVGCLTLLTRAFLPDKGDHYIEPGGHCPAWKPQTHGQCRTPNTSCGVNQVCACANSDRCQAQRSASKPRGQAQARRELGQGGPQAVRVKAEHGLPVSLQWPASRSTETDSYCTLGTTLHQSTQVGQTGQSVHDCHRARPVPRS